MALLAPDALPSSVAPDRAQDDVRDRCEEEAHADARDDEGQDQLLVGTVGVATIADPGEADGLERQSDAHQQSAADAVGHRARDGRHEDRGDRPWQDAQAGLEGRVALHDLEELAEQEDRSEHPEVHQQ